MKASELTAKETSLVFTLLDKAIRQFSLYGQDHPQFQTSLNDVRVRLTEFLSQAGQLAVTVKRDELEWNGETVFRLAKKENNYVQEMYLDGIRQLEIISGVTPEELLGLISVLGRDARAHEVREDDTVTLLWKKGLHSIRCQTIDIYASERFAMLQDDVEDTDEEKQKEERKYLDGFVDRLLHPEDESSLASPPAHPSHADPQFAEDMRTSVPLALFQEQQEETERLREQAIKNGERDTLVEIGTIFAEVLESEPIGESFDRLLQSYLSMVVHLLEDGDLTKTTEWLKRLRGIQLHLGKRDPEFHRTIERAIAGMATPEKFRAFGERLSSGMRSRPEEWEQFLTYLGTESTAAVCELLAYISQETLHTSIMEHLIQHAADQVDIYVQYLKRPEWIVVRDMVRILSAILEEKVVVGALSTTAIHPQAEVRREVVRSMKRFSTKTSHDILRRAVSDSDASVRKIALQLIGRSRDVAFSKYLAAEVAKENFVDRDAEEKKLALSTLARCSGTSAFTFLAQVIETAESGDAADELRVAAVYALREVNDERSIKLLKDLAAKIMGSRSVKEAARQMLERAESGKEDA